jgi:diketogulonate reductase-like aldo/keto reductase
LYRWLPGEVEPVTGEPEPLGWWTISGQVLLEMLQRAIDIGDADIAYAEMYANSEITRPSDQ